MASCFSRDVDPVAAGTMFRYGISAWLPCSNRRDLCITTDVPLPGGAVQADPGFPRLTNDTTQNHRKGCHETH